MSFTRTLSLLLSAAALVALAGPASAQGQVHDSVQYVLVSPPSKFEWGCFDPCACPIAVRTPLAGRFLLRRSHADPLYTWYDVLDVHWNVPDQSTQPTTITGSGTYRIGGEFALTEELTLDLSFNGGPIQRFTSGLRPPQATFPEIHTRISLHAEVCFDSVLEVDANPVGVAGVGGGRVASLTLAPNPFTETTQILFVIPADGVVDLGVYDLAGRRVSGIVERRWLAGGEHRGSWDGRGADGLEAAPGVYWVRIDTPAGRTMRRLVKLD